MYKYLLFDLDGTLTDPKEGITKCIAYALELNGMTPPSMEEMMVCIGPPLYYSFSKIFGMSDEVANKAVADYRTRFREKGIYENAIYPGIAETLSVLKDNGFKIALATSKPSEFAKIILKHFDIDKYFDVVYGSEFDGRRETKTDVIVDVLADLKEKFENTEYDFSEEAFLKKCVMIGDRKHDIIGAKNCHIDSIGVRYGYAPEGELEESGATHIVEDIDELLKYLLDK